MRPQSILMFERLFLASLVVSAGNFLIGYEDTMRVATRDPAMQQLGLGSGFLLGTMAASFAIYLLLWYLIAHRASRAAKWILIVFVALGLVSMSTTLAGPLNLSIWLNVGVYALEVAALVYLFRDDAKAWFAREQPSDPASFD